MDDRNGLITKHLKEFCTGTFLGGISSGSLLFTAGGNWRLFVGEWVVRFIFTSLIALVSGLCSAWAKDLYDNYKKYKKQKRDEYERQQKKERRNGRAA